VDQHIRRLLAASLICSSAVWAAESARTGGVQAASGSQGMHGATMGYLQTGATEVRPILGVPGSTVLGEPVKLPGGIAQLTLAPRQDYAVATGEDGVVPALIRMESSGAKPAVLAGALAHAQLAFSPTGASVALWSAGSLQIWSGFPGRAALVSQNAVSGLKSVAVNDAGTLALAQEDAGRLVVIQAGGAPQMVGSSAGRASLAFLPGSDSALVYSSGTGRLELLQGLGAAFSSRLVADQLDIPAAVLQVSRDGQVAYLAGAGQTTLARIVLATSERTSVATVAPVERLLPLAAADQFLISGSVNSAAWVVALAGPSAQAYFVPPVVVPAAEVAQ
jgi:hypothetical protein